MMNLPNSLTSLRIALIPFLMVALLSNFHNHEWIAFGLFLFATLTDTVDGVLARKINAVTELGQLLDPIADKLLMTAAFICLVGSGHIPAWMAVVIIGRAAKGVIIAASWPGKIKMQLETYTIALLILGRAILGKFTVVPQVLLWLTMGMAVYSAAEYFIKYGPALVKEPEKR
jgi:CDP-diacylglycerol--glycerol-3-phosphate 3-phosphatidyltransferase